jgi:hypothetical protein
METSKQIIYQLGNSLELIKLGWQGPQIELRW